MALVPSVISSVLILLVTFAACSEFCVLIIALVLIALHVPSLASDYQLCCHDGPCDGDNINHNITSHHIPADACGIATITAAVVLFLDMI